MSTASHSAIFPRARLGSLRSFFTLVPIDAGFLFTLKFGDAGNWKIVKTRQMSKKELEENQ